MQAKALKLGTKHRVFGQHHDEAPPSPAAADIGLGPGWREVGWAHVGKGDLLHVYLGDGGPSPHLGTFVVAVGR